jgi:hypothetical protein
MKPFNKKDCLDSSGHSHTSGHSLESYGSYGEEPGQPRQQRYRRRGSITKYSLDVQDEVKTQILDPMMRLDQIRAGTGGAGVKPDYSGGDKAQGNAHFTAARPEEYTSAADEYLQQQLNDVGDHNKHGGPGSVDSGDDMEVALPGESAAAAARRKGARKKNRMMKGMRAISRRFSVDY